MFVSWSAAPVQACGFGEERERRTEWWRRRGTEPDEERRQDKRRGGEDDVFQPEQAINRTEVKGACQGKEVYVILCSEE